MIVKMNVGARKDRHENIGFGHIGFKALNYIVHHPQLMALPKILETPFVGEDKNNKKAPYKFEIEMLRNNSFDENCIRKNQEKLKYRKKWLAPNSFLLLWGQNLLC